MSQKESREKTTIFKEMRPKILQNDEIYQTQIHETLRSWRTPHEDRKHKTGI